MMITTRSFAPLVLIFLLAVGPLAAQSSYQVVVNSANPESAIPKADVAKLFLKKTTTWSNGLKVAAVDQTSSRSVREAFTEGVHGKSVAAIKAYWQKMIFSGRATPPPELANDTDVMTYVRNNSGGIGYVSASATLGSGLKTLSVN
ncbi:MAG: substrate-binding domain-containing protein [Thermoanaerobaculia bacterium]